jgi:hypothetical protein
MTYDYQDDVCKTFMPGRMVTKLEVGDDGNYLRFTFDDHRVAEFVAYGDCCSHTWVNDLNGVDALLGYLIVSCVTKEMDKPDEDEDEDDGDVVQHYGYTITTQKGYFDLLFRTSSNGYYGGSLDLVDDEENSWCDKPGSETLWQVVTKDWSVDA